MSNNNNNEIIKEKRKYMKLNPERKQLIVAYLKGQFDAKGKLNRASYSQCSNLFNISIQLAMRIWKSTNLQISNNNWDFNQLNYKITRKKRKDLKAYYREKLKLADNRDCKSFRQISEIIGVAKSTCYNLFKLGLLTRLDNNALAPNWEVFNSDRVDDSVLGQLGGESECRDNQTTLVSVNDTQSNNQQIANNDSSSVAENSTLDINQSLILPSTLQSPTITNNNESELDLKIDGTIEDEFSD